MRYNQKRNLYESIMRDVAKTVKSRLNENNISSLSRENDYDIFKGLLNKLDEDYEYYSKETRNFVMEGIHLIATAAISDDPVPMNELKTEIMMKI